MSSPLSAVSMGYKRSKYMNYIRYLFDNGNRLLCDPKYAVEGTLNAEAIQKKKMYDDQLRCYLPVMIDLYDELTFTFRFTSQDGMFSVK